MITEEEQRNHGGLKTVKNKYAPWIGLLLVVLLIAGALYLLFGPR